MSNFKSQSFFILTVILFLAISGCNNGTNKNINLMNINHSLSDNNKISSNSKQAFNSQLDSTRGRAATFNNTTKTIRLRRALNGVYYDELFGIIMPEGGTIMSVKFFTATETDSEDFYIVHIRFADYDALYIYGIKTSDPRQVSKVIIGTTDHFENFSMSHDALVYYSDTDNTLVYYYSDEDTGEFEEGSRTALPKGKSIVAKKPILIRAEYDDNVSFLVTLRDNADKSLTFFIGTSPEEGYQEFTWVEDTYDPVEFTEDFDDDEEDLASQPFAMGGGAAGGSSSTASIGFFVPPDSATQAEPRLAVCPLEESGGGKCVNISFKTSSSLVSIASTYLESFESNSFVLVADTAGDIWRTDDLGKNWISSAKLSLTYNIDLVRSLEYDETTRSFELLGYDNKANIIILSSEDGYLWENITVPRFSNISATTNSYCAIENDSSNPSEIGQVWCWGSNDKNKLGVGETESFTPTRALIPAKIGLAEGKLTPVVYASLAGGDSHMCALRITGDKIDCWGDGELGQLGNGVAYGAGYSTPIPTQVNLSGIDSVNKLVSGGSHSCILSGGQVWCWGSNQNKEIDGTSLQNIFPRPTKANFNQPFTYSDVATGADFTCGITAHQINCWGNNYSSNLNPYKTIKLTNPDSNFDNFITLSSGGGNACVLSNNIHNGKTNAWCWGDNTYGQLGNGKIGGSTYAPEQVISNVGPIRFVSLSQSAVNTCGVTDKGFVYCWGDNTYQQTGVSESGPILEAQSPIQLNGFPGNFTTVSAGLYSTCLVSNEINVTGIIHNTYCLGLNDRGQIGIGSVDSVILKPRLVNTIIETESIESITHCK